VGSSQTISTDDRQAVVDLVHRYFWLIDHGLAHRTAECFTETAKLTFGSLAPKPGTIHGAAIGAAMVARSKQTEVTTRHVVSNIALAAIDSSTVQVYSLLTLFRSADASRDTYPVSVADIEDIVVRDAGTWRIQDRTISPIFNRA
jgi:hypothetical protein